MEAGIGAIKWRTVRGFPTFRIGDAAETALACSHRLPVKWPLEGEGALTCIRPLPPGLCVVTLMGTLADLTYLGVAPPLGTRVKLEGVPESAQHRVHQDQLITDRPHSPIGAMESSADFVTRFQEDLRATADILLKCSTLTPAQSDAAPRARTKNFQELEHDMDDCAVLLSKGFLLGTSAENSARTAMREASSAERQCQQRKEAAAASRSDFSALLAIYADNIGSQADSSSRRAAPSPVQEIERFYKKLIEARHGDSAQVTTALCRSLHQGHLRQQVQEDDDLAIEESVSHMCPLTSQPLEEPVRAPCGHYFSRKGIESTFEQSSTASMRCPVGGCRHVIEKNSLLRDPLKDLEVAKSQRDAEKRRLQELQSLMARSADSIA